MNLPAIFAAACGPFVAVILYSVYKTWERRNEDRGWVDLQWGCAFTGLLIGILLQAVALTAKLIALYMTKNP